MEIMKHALVLAMSVPNRPIDAPYVASLDRQTSPNPTIMPRRISNAVQFTKRRCHGQRRGGENEDVNSQSQGVDW